MQKHKHYKEIIAWAEGKEIEILDSNGNWGLCAYPNWHREYQYRVKPKPDYVKVLAVQANDAGGVSASFSSGTGYDSTVEFTFDGETNKLKAVRLLE